jgi:ankyrin repeat protein
LLKACVNGNKGIVSLLIETNADVNYKNKNDITALMAGMKSNHILN